MESPSNTSSGSGGGSGGRRRKSKSRSISRTRRHPKPSTSTSLEKEKDGDGDKPVRVYTPRFSMKSTSLSGFLQERQDDFKDQVQQFHRKAVDTDTPVEQLDIPTEDAFNSSIEIFFGNLTNFGSFCNSLSDRGFKTPTTATASSPYDIPLHELERRQQHLHAQRAQPPPPQILEESSDCEIEELPGIVHQAQVPQDLSDPQDELQNVVEQLLAADSKIETSWEDEDQLEQVLEEAQQDNVDIEAVLVEHPVTSMTTGRPATSISTATKNEQMTFEKLRQMQMAMMEDDNKSTSTVGEDYGSDPEDYQYTNPLKTTVNPCAVKKLCLVGHPLGSFQGLSSFKKLHEAWITNCDIKELKWSDFKTLKALTRLYLFGGQISKIEPLKFENLKILWLSTNRITSLKFLAQGLPTLTELNVADNQITCLEMEHLFKCTSLQILNVAANPLCTIQDVEAVNSVPSVKDLILIDPCYGRCPVASYCESRTFLVHRLSDVTTLSGQDISHKEKQFVKEYIKKRCLYYYTVCLHNRDKHVTLRSNALNLSQKQLNNLGRRIVTLSMLSAQSLQADYQMTRLPMFSKAQLILREEVAKIHTRLSCLKQWTRVLLRRLETLMRISQWELRVEEWLKWVEYKSYAVICGYVALSALDTEADRDKDNLRLTMHQLFSGLSCRKPWPKHSILKIESIIVLKDKASEAAMEKIYEDNYSRKDEPKFIPPPPLDDEPQMSEPQTYPFYGPPCLQPFRVVETYMDPEYRPPEPVFPYPESTMGLPERSQPLLLFLICDINAENEDPLHYFHNLMFSKSRAYKDIKLTNCIWMAAQLNNSKESSRKNVDLSYTVIFVVKALEECLVPMKEMVKSTKRHSEDCMVFGLDRPLSYAPAYVLYVSHIPNEKGAIWYEGINEDLDVSQGVEQILETVNQKLSNYGAAGKGANAPYFIHRTHDGIKADLTAITQLATPKNPQPTSNLVVKSKHGTDILNVAKFLGSDVAGSITSLDLSGNRLTLTVGLEGLINLKKLNLSRNSLSTLSGLHKLPLLKEFRCGWNNLRFVHSNLKTLVWACRGIVVLELLPNPYQDVRNYAEIPLLAQQVLPCLTRVDAWTAPFKPPSKLNVSCSKALSNIEDNFTRDIMTVHWAGQNVTNLDYKGRVLTTLESFQRFPLFPHFRDRRGNNGVLLDLSDNYLSSSSLSSSPLVQNSEWRECIFKLELQENCIGKLDWMVNSVFPNLQILNMSNNELHELDGIDQSCPNLIHLQVSGNHFPCNMKVLEPVRGLVQLKTLDMSRSPVSTHPEYPGYILHSLKNIKILDGVPRQNWNTEDSIHRFGGLFDNDWLDQKLGARNWSHLTHISLPSCNLQKVDFPPGSLPNLLSADLNGNSLSEICGLACLPNLRVLSASYNKIDSLGGTCPTCFEITTETRGNDTVANLYHSNFDPNHSGKQFCTRAKSPERHKFRGFSPPPTAKRVEQDAFKPQTKGHASAQHYGLGGLGSSVQDFAGDPKQFFPKLEVLVLSHNGLKSAENLHLHSLPSLHTVVLSCNRLKAMKGLDELTTLRALVLDCNSINTVPFKCMIGCNNLRHLHLEHNRIAALPRFPNLCNLVALHLGHNRVQSLANINSLSCTDIQELTLVGNPACKSDYFKNVVTNLPRLQKLDGVSVIHLRLSHACEKPWSLRYEVSSDWFETDVLPSADYAVAVKDGLRVVYKSYDTEE